MSDEATRVVFRKWRKCDGGGVIALFPGEAGWAFGYVSSFEHVGQHGAADYTGVVSRTTPAAPDEYEPLMRELQSAPYSYRLDVRKRR